MRKNKSVSFDLEDEYERVLLEFAEKEENGRYSRYVKRLIANDMKSKSVDQRQIIEHRKIDYSIDSDRIEDNKAKMSFL